MADRIEPQDERLAAVIEAVRTNGARLEALSEWPPGSAATVLLERLPRVDSAGETSTEWAGSTPGLPAPST